MDVLQMLSSILYLGFVDLTIIFYMFVVISHKENENIIFKINLFILIGG